jgi:drug/metabolite transporter (DMT)-like permease
VPVISHAEFVGFAQIIYQIYKPNGSMQLYEFIIIFGILMLILSQLPSFHSLRHINLASLVFCLGFSLCVVGGSIYVGRNRQDLVNVLLSI